MRMLQNARRRISEEPYWFLNYWPKALVAWCTLRGCDWDKHNTVSSAFACFMPLIKFLLSIFSFFLFVFLHISFSTTCLKLCSSTPSCFSLFFLKSIFICFFLTFICFPSFHTWFPHFLFSSLSSYLWSIDCFEYVFNKHKLIGFLFHLQSYEIDGPSPIINSRVCWKDPLLLNWFRLGKKSIVCFSYWWKCIAHSSCSVK